MGVFTYKYPMTDFNEYNLDWIISETKRLIAYFEELDEFASKEYVDTEINKLRVELKRLIDLKVNITDYNVFVHEVRESLLSISGTLETLQSAVAINAQAIVDTYRELKQYIDDQIIDLQVINPMTGVVQPIQIVLNYMADLLRADALSAQEYDRAQLTAAAYDALQLTAYVYDNYGKNYIN